MDVRLAGTSMSLEDAVREYQKLDIDQVNEDSTHCSGCGCDTPMETSHAHLEDFNHNVIEKLARFPSSQQNSWPAVGSHQFTAELLANVNLASLSDRLRDYQRSGKDPSLQPKMLRTLVFNLDDQPAHILALELGLDTVPAAVETIEGALQYGAAGSTKKAEVADIVHLVQDMVGLSRYPSFHHAHEPRETKVTAEQANRTLDAIEAQTNFKHLFSEGQWNVDWMVKNFSLEALVAVAHRMQARKLFTFYVGLVGNQQAVDMLNTDLCQNLSTRLGKDFVHQLTEQVDQCAETGHSENIPAFLKDAAQRLSMSDIQTFLLQDHRGFGSQLLKAAQGVRPQRELNAVQARVEEIRQSQKAYAVAELARRKEQAPISAKEYRSFLAADANRSQPRLRQIVQDQLERYDDWAATGSTEPPDFPSVSSLREQVRIQLQEKADEDASRIARALQENAERNCRIQRENGFDCDSNARDENEFRLRGGDYVPPRQEAPRVYYQQPSVLDHALQRHVAPMFGGRRR